MSQTYQWIYRFVGLPISAAVTVWNSSGAVATTGTTDEFGALEVELATGRYFANNAAGTKAVEPVAQYEPGSGAGANVADASITGGTAGAGVKIAATTITNANISATAAIAESKLSLASDAAAGTASRRTLGTSATSAAAGNDVRLGSSQVSRLKPAGALAETFPRANGPAIGNAGTALYSAAVEPQAIWLDAGTVISNISFVIGSTGSTSTSHWWFGLYDSSRVQLATTADQLTATITASAVATLPIATTAAGAGTSFTTTYTGLHYVGIMVTATTPPNVLATGTTATLTGIAPILAGYSDGAQTTPPAFPHTITGITALSQIIYAFVS